MIFDIDMTFTEWPSNFRLLLGNNFKLKLRLPSIRLPIIMEWRSGQFLHKVDMAKRSSASANKEGFFVERLIIDIEIPQKLKPRFFIYGAFFTS